MNKSSTSTLWRYGLFNLAIFLLIGAWLWYQNQSVTIPDAALPVSGKLQCVSYAPYYGVGQSPLIKGYRVSQAQIIQDLTLLAKHTECVRIYSISQGLDYVPEAASKLGLKVLLGAWIGWVKADNELELNAAIKLANQFPQTVTGLVVGNEVLLRGEQTEAAMAAYLRQAKQATNIPVTYADVWEYWLKHPKLESSVDFVTVHVLPYWEDDPQPVSNAINHVNIVMDKLASTFKKPLLIGETGWPSAGRHRNASVPSPVSQAQYVRGFLQRAHEANWRYNVIEAVDQPWKRTLEGAVGGYWGLFDTDLQLKFPLTGNFSERHDGLQAAYWALGGLLIWLGVIISAGERRQAALFSAALLGASAGLLAMLQVEYLAIACRDNIEWLALGGLNLVGIATLLAIPAVILNQHRNTLISEVGNTAYSVLFIRAGLLALIAGTAIAGVLLMPKALVLEPLSKAIPSLGGFLYNLDGRYRDFPLSIYLLPVLQLTIGLWLVGLPALARIQKTLPSNASSDVDWPYYKHLSLIALLPLAILLIAEPLNTQAYAWIAIVACLAVSCWPKPNYLSNKATNPLSA